MRSPKKLAMAIAITAPTGFDTSVEPNNERHAPPNPAQAKNAPRAGDVVSPARQSLAQEHAHRIADAAKEQRQHAQQRRRRDLEVPSVSEIRRQPGDVEIPAVGQAKILPAQQPDATRSSGSVSHGTFACPCRQLGTGPHQLALSAVNPAWSMGLSRNQRKNTAPTQAR